MKGCLIVFLLAVSCLFGLIFLWDYQQTRFPPINDPDLLVEQCREMLEVRLENADEREIIEGVLSIFGRRVPRDELLSEIERLSPRFAYFDSQRVVDPSDRLVIVISRRGYLKLYVVFLEEDGFADKIPEDVRKTKHPNVYKILRRINYEDHSGV